jgi:adenine deaminase
MFWRTQFTKLKVWVSLPLGFLTMKEFMKFEEAMSHLRAGKRIARESSRPEDMETLQARIKNGIVKFVGGSYYMTVFDILADDWEVVE